MSVQPAQIGIPSGTTSYSDTEINAILATIRQQESGGNYTIVTSGGSDACGAYQYISSTWSAMFDRALAAGYLPAGTQKTARACEAPPAVQDAVARYDVISFLDSVGGDVSKVPLHWYYPAAIGNPALLSFTPPGNNISIGAYQANWMKAFANISKDPALAKTWQAQETNAFTDALGVAGQALLVPGGNITGLFDSLAKVGGSDLRNIFRSIAQDFLYFGEIVGGFLILTLGVIIVLVDTGTLSKMPMPVPVPV